MTTFAVPETEELPDYIQFKFGYMRGCEKTEYANYELGNENGIKEAEVARWLNRALASSGLTTLQVMVKP